MKKFLFYALVLVLPLFILSSCSKDNTSPTSSENIPAQGKLLLKIDKVNAPLDVASVTAYLSRTNLDTLSKNLNLVSDSTASVTFNNVQIGTWHLKVEAKNALGIVIYSGETDVIVEESKTTEVLLTLIPKPTGLGSISISINWGSTIWTDFALNPIVTKYESATAPSGGISVGRMLFEDGKYKMWFTNTYEGSRGDIGYVESVDGINWKKVTQNAVLLPGNYGAWDDKAVTTGAVLKDGNEYKLYYTGYNSASGLCSIGLATSPDGIHWEKIPNPVLPAGTDYKVGASDIVKKDGVYFLYYNTLKYSDTDRGMGVATSTDGRNWTKYQNNPILTTTQSWEGVSIYTPTVFVDNGIFKLYYTNHAGSGIGEAISNDGLSWVKNSANPVFKTQDVSRKWTEKIYAPFCRRIGNQYKLYYSGSFNNEMRIGLITR